MKRIGPKQWLIIGIVSLILLMTVTNPTSQDMSLVREYPSKPITVIVAYGAGGATDLGARLLLPYVEEELGIPLRIVNVNGDAGWAGWKQLLDAPPDGYTIAYINTPSLLTGNLNPRTGRHMNIGDLSLIANQVIDYGAIAIRNDEARFTSIGELIEYAGKYEVTATSTGLASDDHLAVLKLNSALHTHFIAAHTANTGKLKEAVIGRHIDVYFGNVGELTLAHKRKELRVIALLAPERSAYLPGIPTLEEELGVKIYSWAARGIAGPPGIAKERVDILTAAFLRAMKNEKFQKEMDDAGLALRPMDSGQFRELLAEDERGVRSVLHLVNW